MTKSDLRKRVYQAADELFIERGSLQGFGYREVRERAKGASNDVMPLFEDWKASREQMLRTRPDSLVAVAEEFAARLWLMARLMAAPDGSTAPVAAKVDPPAIAGGPRSGNRATARSAASARPAGPAADRRRSDGGALFSDIPRPGRVAKTDTEKAKKRAGPVERLQIREAGRKVFVLVPPRPAATRPALTDTDWSGAKNEPLAKEVATLLRKKADRMRASEIHKKLPAGVRPGTAPHAQRDLQRDLAGSRIEWSPGGWFWFRDEPVPKHRDRRTHRTRKSDIRETRCGGASHTRSPC